MPLGYLRLNERTQRPNPNINFIKPLSTASPQDQEIAKDFLERIAAQCYPVMKQHYLLVNSLEEYAPNPEFLGRNFNAGEAIQLVLKDKAGRWLSFKFVQMVMMHELAHCKQMNHSRFFWKVRNEYADQMKVLWSKKYEGEGLWGRGQHLSSGEVFNHGRTPEKDDIPEHLCGGAYRRARGKKRKRGQDGPDKPKVSYAERQQKRIAKKFGVHGEGQGLGEDELVRGALEQGKRSYGKPRVANSKRGRELRANAALARFDAAKKKSQTPELTEDDGSETESDVSEDEYADRIDILNKLSQIEDEHGRNLYKVCGDENEEDEGGLTELDELRLMGSSRDQARQEGRSKRVNSDGGSTATQLVPHDDSETESEPDDTPMPQPASNSGQRGQSAAAASNGGEDTASEERDVVHSRSELMPAVGSRSSGKSMSTPQRSNDSKACPICSLENEPSSPTCMACSHVLKPNLVRNHWRCKSEQCKGSKYINAGDVGRCGLCGAQKPAVESKPMGVTNSDVLRWD